MGRGHLFDEFVDKQLDTSDFDKKAAFHLKEAVQKKARVVRPVSIKRWAKEFTKLRKMDGISKERITACLDWYRKNIRRQFIPIAFSAKTFREKFPRLEAAMSRLVHENPDVDITDRGKKAAKQPLKKKWPKGSRDQVQLVAQISLNNLEQLRRNILRTMIFGEKLRKLVSHILWVLRDPVQIVSNWLLHVNTEVSKWKNWSGDLKYYILVPNETHMDMKGREWVEAYCGDGNKWKYLMEMVYAD